MKTSKKKHSFHNKYVYIYTGHRNFESFMKLYFVHIVITYCITYSSPYIHNTLPALRNEKKNSKLNFTKNRQGSCFSHRRLKISKWSISLAQLNKCSKTKVIPLISLATYNLQLNYLPMTNLCFQPYMILIFQLVSSYFSWAYKWKMTFNPDLSKQAQEVTFSTTTFSRKIF